MIITNTQAISTLKAAACQETFFVAALSVGMARVLVVIITAFASRIEQMAEWLRGFASRIDLGRHGRSFLLQSTPDSIKIATQSTHRAATEHA